MIKPEPIILGAVNNIYSGLPIPNVTDYHTILDLLTNRKVRCSWMTSSQIWMLLKGDKLIAYPNLTPLANDEAKFIYKNIGKFKNIPNKTKMLKLIHGDVYCSARLKKFGMTDNNTCIKCFDREIIKHLM